MISNEIREKFLKFFEDRGHKIMPSSSLIPNDSSVLFTTAGMQQFKPYYTDPELAIKDFGNKNITTVQKCIRTGDIDEVGDNTHLTFFEMLGNFSFGGYGRKKAIEYAYEFITKEMDLEISYVTIYKGNKENNISKDNESEKIWKNLGLIDIREEGSDLFWGPTGDSGPCGPTTEIYCKNASGENVEIWNIVFNEYFSDVSREKLDKGEAKLSKLPVLGIDTGMGLERLVTIVNKKESVYETDMFNGEETREERIISDHIRASLFIISDGVKPSNTGSGYILRRIIRRAVRFSGKSLQSSIDFYKKFYEGIYQLEDNEIIKEEEIKFKKTLKKGLKEFEKTEWVGVADEKIKNKKGSFLGHAEEILSGEIAFNLFTTYGFPIELTQELAREKGIKIDLEDFNKKLKNHQELSRTSSKGMFKGGLINHNKKTIQLHTAHHLLLAGLQAVVNKDIKQKGSNINEKRLRIDFLCDHKLTNEEKEKVEDWVNDKIEKGIDVIKKEIPIEEAKKLGAQMEFGKKYEDIVSIYFIEDEKGNIYSKEFCGGPHVLNTKKLGKFKIKKEESVASGVRRIKATLE